jgi:hypothetical protein
MSTSPQSDPRVLLICHDCRLVHSDTGGWMTKKTYRDTMGIDPITCRLKHTYCPWCYDFLISHGRAA